MNILQMRKILTAIATLFICPFICGVAHADFALSVTPYEGGYDLDFGRTDGTSTVTKEVVFRATSSLSKQYRIVQALYEPLSNASGTVIPYQNLGVSSVIGSNRTGTISVDHEAIVSPGQQILFTSNTQGTAETFTLVYALKSPLNVPSGSYRGRIIISLEAADASEAPQRVYLTITATVEGGSSVEIKTSSGSKLISLEADSEKNQNAEAAFTVKTGFPSQYRIFQSADAIRAQDGTELPDGSISFFVQGAQTGSAPANPTALPQGESLIYASSPAGKAESFTVAYAFTPQGAVKAGRYQGKLRYYMTTGSGMVNLETFALEIRVEKIFDLAIKTLSGEGTISFPDLKPGSSRQFEMQLNVRNNTGARYQVNQKILSELMNKEGQPLSGGKYTVVTEKLKETRGEVKLPVPVDVKVGETALFVSDTKGTTDSFKVLYELVVPQDSKAGDYASSVSFTLSEL